MNIRDLEYLVALAEHRHFRRAADSCHVSQPTLSGQIRKLEDELGVMLLERTSRKVLFTQAGLLLVEQARTVLREVKVLKEMASQQGEAMSGPLHIGLIPTVGPYLLPQIIPTLHKTFPKLEMYLHEAQTQQLLAQLDSGKLDCAILALVKETEAFIEVPLFDEPMKLAVYSDHPWAQRDRVAMPDLAGEKLLMLEDGHCLRDQRWASASRRRGRGYPLPRHQSGNAAQYGRGRQRYYPAAVTGGAAAARTRRRLLSGLLQAGTEAHHRIGISPRFPIAQPL